MLTRRKLNSIESKLSETLINNEDFMTVINEEKNTENQKKALE